MGGERLRLACSTRNTFAWLAGSLCVRASAPPPSRPISLSPFLPFSWHRPVAVLEGGGEPRRELHGLPALCRRHLGHAATAVEVVAKVVVAEGPEGLGRGNALVRRLGGEQGLVERKGWAKQEEARQWGW